MIFLHSVFHSDRKVDFCSFIILFKFSNFIFCSCVSVCSVLLGCVMFLFFEVSPWFLLACSCLSKPSVSDAVLVSCSLFVFWSISNILRSENQPFFIIVLTWSASLWLVVWKLVHSCQISIILCLYPCSVGLLLKYQCNVNWLHSLVYVLCLRL